MDRIKRMHFAFAFLLSIALLLIPAATSYSGLHHECSGEDCPVCLVAEIAETSFRSFLSDAFIANGIACLAFPLVLCICFKKIFVENKSPVVNKTKLSN